MSALQFPPELLLRAQGGGLGTDSGIQAAIFDVDGVLTDGRLYIGEAGEVFKAFHVLDGHGLKLLARVGITPVVITGRDSPAVHRRMADLGLADAFYGVADKLAVAQALLAARGWAWPQLAVIGDDWPDGHAEAQALAHHVTAARGREGAAREFCDLLLAASGRYAELLAAHQGTLDGR